MLKQRLRAVHRRPITAAFLVGAAFAGFVAAQAQQAVLPTTPVDVGAPNAGQLPEIIVTAERREESNQHVPMAITAVSRDTAERVGVTDTQSLAGLVPGLTFNRQTNASVPFLRGVGTPVGQSGDEPSVALYIDDVYMPAGAASVANFNSIEHIEVEKGPQGTLFGRNATGGVVQIFTRNPTPRPELEVRVGYGNYDTWLADAYANSPLSEHVLANVAVYWSNQAAGWGKNQTTGLPTFRFRDNGGRVKVLWTPTEGTGVLVSLDFNRTVFQQPLGFQAWPGTGSLDPLPPFHPGGLPPAPGYYDLTENFNSGANDRQYGASLKLTQTLDWGRIVSISAYRDTRGDSRIDQDSGSLPIVNVGLTNFETTFTQELQLLSRQDSRVSWIGGVFYLDDKTGYAPLHFTGDAFTPLPFVDSYGTQATQSWALFAQATAAIQANTHLTAGARYTQDNREMRAAAVFGGGAATPAPNSPQSKTWSNPSWRVTLDHQLTHDVMGYLAYNRGFKSGLFNTVVLAGSPIDKPVDPEKLDSYALGLKSELFDHRLRFNLEGFYYDYKNIQVEEILTGVTHITNAAKATIKGLDLEISAMPTERLTLTAALEGLQGHYDSFPDGTFYVYNAVLGGNCIFAVAPPPAPAPCGGDVVPPNYNPSTGHWDLKGNHTVQTPPFSANLMALYAMPSAIGRFDFNVSWAHSGNYFVSADNGLGQILPSSSRNTMQGLLNVVNASLGWSSTGAKWQARLWVKNLTDLKYWSYADLQAFATQYSPASPRTYGVIVTKRFE